MLRINVSTANGLHHCAVYPYQGHIYIGRQRGAWHVREIMVVSIGLR